MGRMQAGKGNAAKWVWLALGMLFSPVQPGGAQAPVAETFTLDEAADALAIGRAAYEDGLFDLSRRRLEELVEKAPDRRRRAEGAIWLARVSLAQGKPDAALAMLQQVSEVRAISLLAELALTRAQAYAAKGDWKTVALELAPFQERFVGQSNAPVALHLLVHMLAAEQKWEEARQAILLLEDRYPEHPETVAAWLELAEAMMAANEIAAAEQMYASVEAAYAGRPLAEQATLRLAELQLAREEGADAMTLLQGLMADTNLLAETRAQVYQVVARALATETNLAAALDAIDKGIELAADPARQLENQVIKAQLLLQAGRLEEGSAAFRRAVAQIPEESLAARLQLNLADWLAHAGEREKAAEEYQAWLEAFEGEEGTADALAGYAWTLWEAGRYAEAAPMFARAALVESNESRQVNLLAKQADAEFAARQYSQAEKNYTRVLPLAGKDRQMQERIQLQLAETELALGKTQAGEVRLLDLSRTRGKSPFAQTATMRLGVLYEERGALESAVEQYSRLLAGEADAELKAEALLARGLIRYRMGSFQAALDDFTRIREEFSLTAPAAQAMFMRGWCLYLLGKDEEALEVCKRFLVEYPNSIFAPDVHFWLGEYAFNHGEYEEAENRFADVAREYPASPHAADALYWAGRAATARRAYLAANEHYNELMARYPDTLRLPETLLAQGDMLSELGQFALAIVAYDEVIGKAPQSVEAMIAWGRKGDSQYTLGQQESGRYEEALLSYRTLAESTSAALDLRLQAGYKTGRCLEKMGRETAALDRYMEVVYAYLQEARPTAETTVWFTRAAFRAATVQEKAGNWKQAVGIYRRVADAGVPSSTEARERISRIQREHWTQF